MEITGAKVHVSSADEVYPGTNDRIVLISGSDSSVSCAQALIWQLLAQNFRAIEAVRLYCDLKWVPRSKIYSISWWTDWGLSTSHFDIVLTLPDYVNCRGSEVKLGLRKRPRLNVTIRIRLEILMSVMSSSWNIKVTVCMSTFCLVGCCSRSLQLLSKKMKTYEESCRVVLRPIKKASIISDLDLCLLCRELDCVFRSTDEFLICKTNLSYNLTPLLSFFRTSLLWMRRSPSQPLLEVLY